MRRVILESPFAGNLIQRWLNRRYARRCLHDCLKRGEAPFASHLLYTQPGVLRDGMALEREQGIRAGLIWGEQAQATVVYVDRGISAGMLRGMDLPKRSGDRSNVARSTGRAHHEATTQRPPRLREFRP
jgi:hypothetical protein